MARAPRNFDNFPVSPRSLAFPSTPDKCRYRKPTTRVHGLRGAGEVGISPLFLGVIKVCTSIAAVPRRLSRHAGLPVEGKNQLRGLPPETGSHQTAPTATQSAL